MTNPTGPVRWLYIYLLNSAHGDVLLDMHDSLFKPIHTHDISRLIRSLFSEEQT